MQGTTTGVASAAVAMNFVSSFLNQASPHSTFAAINQIQLLLLLLLLKIYLPQKIINYIRSLSITLFNLNIDPSFWGGGEWIVSSFDFEQEREDLWTAGMESGSTFINLFDSVLILLSVSIVHLLILPCYLKASKGAKTSCMIT